MSGLTLVNGQQPPYQLILNSKNAIYKNAKSSVVQFQLPVGSEVNTDTQTCIVQLLDFFAVNSMYNIRSDNNSLVFRTLWYDPSTQAYRQSDTTLEVPPGGYDMLGVNPLVDTVNTLFVNGLALWTFGFTPSNAICTFSFHNWYTNQILPNITATNQFVGLYLLSTSSLAQPLGFDVSQCIPLPNSTTERGWPALNLSDPALAKLQAHQPPNLLYPGTIVIKIDQLNTNNRATGFGLGEIFEVIHSPSVFGGIIEYQSYLGFASHIAKLHLNSLLTVRIVDINNKELDWNGGDWHMTLGMQWALDTSLGGIENADLSLNNRPITHNYPNSYDSLNANRKRGR